MDHLQASKKRQVHSSPRSRFLYSFLCLLLTLTSLEHSSLSIPIDRGEVCFRDTLVYPFACNTCIKVIGKRIYWSCEFKRHKSFDLSKFFLQDRKVVLDKIVVKVKLEESEGKKKSDQQNPSCDSWSWRKYGQKPIKGSPYPRGYYKCSTSKSCSAKKQVEICRTDASILIITYTSTHNHPNPNLSKQSKNDPKPEIDTTLDPDQDTTLDNDQENEEQKPVVTTENGDFCYIETLEDEGRLAVNLENTFFDDEPLSYPDIMKFSASKTEENDFYDELEELPMSSSSFKSFMSSNFFEERVLVQPS